MKIRIMTVAGLVFMLASAVGAQTKFTGTVTCAKPDPNYTIDAPDHPGHSYSLEKDSPEKLPTPRLSPSCCGKTFLDRLR